MADKKYILDVDQDLPRFPWYGRRYRKANRVLIDTTGWAKIGPEEGEELKQKHEKSIKQVASRIRISQKLSNGLEANMKGKVLLKCELPQNVQTQVNRVLDWSLDSGDGYQGEDVGQNNIEQEELSLEGEKSIDMEKELKTADLKMDPTNTKDNPYGVFLDAVAGEDDDKEDRNKGLIGGLKSWLGFAGTLSQTGSAPSAPADQQKPPWLKGENTGDDTMTKKAEENMTKIAGEFCAWLKDLPGEDQSVNQISETHLRSLFDTAQSANPGTTKLAEGLRSWAKFGSKVTGEVTVNIDPGTGKAQASKARFVEKLLGTSGASKQTNKHKEVSKHEKMLYYGAWYLDPKDWEKRYHRQIETQGGTNIEDKTKGKLQACLPGQVDLMGIQQPISQLHSTKAFGAYLSQKKNYKKPKFIKNIMTSSEI